MISNIIHLFDIQKLLDASNKLNSFGEMKPLIDEKLDHFFKTQLPKKMPIVSMFIGDKTVNQLKEVFMDELDQILPELIPSFIQKNDLNLKIAEIIDLQIQPQLKKITNFAFLFGCIWSCIISLLAIYFSR